MRQEQWEGNIIPAQLAFFAIYSPPLGLTDETFKEQVVFYYSREAREAKLHKKKTGAGSSEDEEHAAREERNEQLRQVGLAQGMVDFARSFSNGEAVDSVDSEKSRIIMHELEKGWWMLASIDLTRLGTPATGVTKGQKEPPRAKVEYSSREVSPAPLLLQQVLTAYRTLLLHHGPRLSDLYVRSTRDKFCNIIDRYWTRFCRNWDVLLHGNPAVEAFGGIKLAAGGELGVGVGEEEWGSGEREVLEDLIRQTEGLVDLTVSRFGQAAPPEPDNAADNPSGETISEAASGFPWLGCGHLPAASDGVIFGGSGAITRASLRDVSEWVQQIYTYGEYAYGVKDNPQRQRRKRRRRAQGPVVDDDQDANLGPTDLKKLAAETNLKQQQQQDRSDEKPAGEPSIILPHDPRPQVHDRVASHDHATGQSSPQIASHPGIPPPIVTAAEESLNAASSAADAPRKVSDDRREAPSRFGVSDKWVKYLTLGLSTYAGGDAQSKSRPEAPRRTSSSSSRTLRAPRSKSNVRQSKEPDIPEDVEESAMAMLDPAPDGFELSSKIATQRYLENKGHYLIGYKGDLDSMHTDDDGASAASVPVEDGGERNILRVLQIELKPSPQQQSEDAEGEELGDFYKEDSSAPENEATKNHQRLRVLVYVHRPFIYTFLFEQRTGSLQLSSFYKSIHNHLRPLHKPLLRSTSLQQVAQRIAEAHYNSSQEKPDDQSQSTPNLISRFPVFDLVFDPLKLTTHTSIPNIPDPGTPAAEGITTSSPSSSSSSSTNYATTSTGYSGPPNWTRLEAINVHSAILNTLSSTSSKERDRLERERTSKTSRGWWIVWMRIPSTPAADSDGEEGAVARGRDRYEDCRTAFLVRKASDGSSTSASSAGGLSTLGGLTSRKTSRHGLRGASVDSGRAGYASRVSSGMGSMFGFGLGFGGASTSFASAAAGNNSNSPTTTTAAAAAAASESGGVMEEGSGPGWGLGIDARKYVEGLLSLNR
ncbi:hypothetical protein AAFC00_004491 [Neodothiora populina]|uniref:CCZ1/INTU/HSP4 first Longin domain-containing protein n=1 Tax=Neodothiora populina TaxID=2781224 RepID=A0ABR3P2I4_9PEZI